MDNPVIPLKTIGVYIIIGLFLLILSSIIAINQPENKIVICAENEKLTVVGRFNFNFDAVFSSASAKNLLYCLGKSAPYFDRKIEVVFKSDGLAGFSELSKRYKIDQKPEDNILKINKLEITVDSIGIVTSGEERILILSTTPRSPFSIIQQIKKEHIESLIMPETEEAVYKILLSYFKGDEAKIKVVKNETRLDLVL